MAASGAMVAAGEHLSSSRPVRRAKTRPAERIPVCVEPPLPFAEGPGPGRDWWEKALSEKSFRTGKHENSQQNQGVGAKSRTTNLGPFGEVIRATGPMVKANPFRFSTKYQDDETDLIYYGYRYEKDGRWLSRDPLGEKGGNNLYAFVRNDPIQYVDPRGHSSTCCGCGPDVTDAVTATLSAIDQVWAGWDGSKRSVACEYLYSIFTGGTAWDMYELFGVPDGAGKGCDRKATFNGKCYYVSAINYAMWGKINKLCFSDPRVKDRADHNLEEATDKVLSWKKHFYGDTGEEAQQAAAFTSYGFGNGLTSGGDSKCQPCKTKWKSGGLDWLWEPYHPRK